MTEAQSLAAAAGIIEATDEDKVRAFNLLDAALTAGWSLGSLYYGVHEHAFKCSMRRFVKVSGSAGRGSIRQHLEQTSGSGPTPAAALAKCAINALDDGTT